MILNRFKWELVFKFFLWVNAAWMLFIFWRHLNVFQFDLSGHIASATAFRRGLYHEYDDSHFLGSIHGLFYPPLEDMILSLCTWICGSQALLGYQIYLSLLYLAFTKSITALSEVFEQQGSKVVFLLGALLLLLADKNGIINHQGLSNVDLIHIGLSTEFLGAIGFFYFMRELLGKKRSWVLITALTGVILSHIVVTLVLFILLLLMPKRLPGLAKSLAIAFGLSAFYWVPFVLHKSFLTTANIYTPVFWGLPALGAIGLLFSNVLTRPFFLASVLLVAPSLLLSTFADLKHFIPDFHYYRLTIFAYWLTLIGFALSRFKGFLLLLGTLAFCFCVTHELGLKFGDLTSPLLQLHPLPSVSGTDLNIRDTHPGRIWTIDHERGIGISVDSALSAQNENIWFTKGLFWESQHSNSILSSYLVTLFGGPGMLNFFYYPFENCAFESCMIDSFVRDYNVHSVLTDTNLSQNYFGLGRVQCFKDILNRGSNHFNWVAQTKIETGGVQYTLEHLEAKSGLPLDDDNTFATLLTGRHFQEFTPRNPDFFADYMRQAAASCRQGHPSKLLYVNRDQIPAGLDLKSIPLPKVDETLTYRRIRTGSYEFDLKSERPQLFRISLSFLPGLTLTDESGNGLPLLESLPGMIAYGRGKMHLDYHQTLAMKFGYGMTLLTLLGCLLGWARKRVRAQ